MRDAPGDGLSTLLALQEGQCSRSSKNNGPGCGRTVLESGGFAGCRTEPGEGGDHICTIKGSLCTGGNGWVAAGLDQGGGRYHQPWRRETPGTGRGDEGREASLHRCSGGRPSTVCFRSLLLFIQILPRQAGFSGPREGTACPLPEALTPAGGHELLPAKPDMKPCLPVRTTSTSGSTPACACAYGVEAELEGQPARLQHRR